MKAPMMKKLPMPAAKKAGAKPAMPGIEIEIGEEEEPEDAAGEEGGEAMDLKSLMGGEEEGAEESEAEDLSHLSDEALMAEVRKRKLAMGGAEKPAPEMPE